MSFKPTAVKNGRRRCTHPPCVFQVALYFYKLLLASTKITKCKMSNQVNERCKSCPADFSSQLGPVQRCPVCNASQSGSRVEVLCT